MRTRILTFILAGFFLLPQLSLAQTNTNSTNCPGVPGACGYPATTANPAARSGPSNNQSPQNGNGTLGVIYDQAKCGLDFTSASQRLGKRGSIAGVNQPAPFVISGIPACAVIEKAYLWAEGSGNGMAQTATINGPLGSANYPMAVVGQGPDKCWGYSGSYTYRADVTASVNGNGTYNISGILTNPPTAGNDMDGATLMVIWSQASANWQGRIIIADGAIVVNGGTSNYNLPISPAVCGATTGGRAFCGIGDLQMAVGSLTLNGTATPVTWNWWNYVQQNTTNYTVGQATANFQCSTGGDCFNFCLAGAYFRTTTCAVCPTSTALTLTTSSTAAACSACNGSASVTVSPSGTYTYSWAPSGGTGSTATGLCAGTYTVTVSDACNTATAVVTVASAGGGITVSSAGQTNILCNGQCTGTATAAASGGTAPYTYAWAPSGGNAATATGLCAGTYTCTATDAVGCTGTQVFTITQPTAITLTPVQTNVTCNGGCNGTAGVTPSGGTPGYTYAWAPSGGNASTASGLCAGNYTVTVTDANGCVATQTYSITQPTAITATTSFVSATCGGNNGSATVNPSGGTPGYTYQWSSGGTNPTESNLFAGTYTCTITDANLCTFTITVTVPISGSPTATITAFTNVTCFGACDGTATVTTGSGTPPYTYAWTPSGGTGANATGLCPGAYTVTVTDANGCSATDTVVITEPPQLTLSTSQVDVLCNGNTTGSATVTAAGGIPPYSYSWSSGGTGATESGLGAGPHTVTVTDDNGCTATASVTITEPPALTLAAAGFNVTCNGACDGQVVVIPTGGTPNYAFSWSTGCTTPSCNNICAGTYNVTVTDMNGCTASATTTVTEPAAIAITTGSVDAHCNQADGSASASATGGTGTLTYQWLGGGPASANYNNIIPGTYTVVVTDDNNCTDTAFVTVNNIPGVTATPGTSTNVSCFGACDGTAACIVTGGTGTLTYAWSPAGGNTANATGLCAGPYTCTVTDSAGCTSTMSVTITEPPQLTLTASAAPAAVCEGQSVTLSSTAGGGTPGYQYLWLPTGLPGSSQTFVPSGTLTHTVAITDANGCTDSATVLVTVNPMPVAALSGDVLSGCAPLCVNFTDNSTGGAATSWLWDFGDGNTSTLQNPGHCYTVPGPYTVILTVTTANGCTNTVTMANYINVFANPVAAFTAGPQPTTELNPLILFTDQSTGADTWSWNFGDVLSSSSTLQHPTFEYPGNGCFDVTLTVTTVNGCVSSTVQEICIDPDVTLFVPNAFTPNADGSNDIFFPQGIGIDPEQFEMWIFDRWGNLIYYTEDITQGWNGCVQGSSQVAQIDTYVWKIKAVDLLGKKHSLIGKVSLIR